MQHINHILDERTINCIPIGESAHELTIGCAFDEPRIIITSGALIVWIFFFDGFDKGWDAPPLALRNIVDEVHQKLACDLRLVLPFSFTDDAGDQSQFIEGRGGEPSFVKYGQCISAGGFKEFLHSFRMKSVVFDDASGCQ